MVPDSWNNPKFHYALRQHCSFQARETFGRDYFSRWYRGGRRVMDRVSSTGQRIRHKAGRRVDEDCRHNPRLCMFVFLSPSIPRKTEVTNCLLNRSRSSFPSSLHLSLMHPKNSNLIPLLSRINSSLLSILDRQTHQHPSLTQTNSSLSIIPSGLMPFLRTLFFLPVLAYR